VIKEAYAMTKTKAILICIAGGVLLDLAGNLLLGLGVSAPGRLLAVYPGTLAFYLIPQSFIDAAPEPLLYVIGAASGILVIATILCLGLLALGALMNKIEASHHSRQE
jgi:hypothetical protein